MRSHGLVKTHMPHSGKPKSSGFSLLELIIVVAIVGIVSAVAIPSYLDHIRKTRRGDAHAAMLALSNALERYYIDARSFEDAPSPGDLYSSKSPVDGSETYYILTITSTRRTFTVKAEPKNNQADDKCGTLTLTRSGVKGVEGASSGFDADICWRS